VQAARCCISGEGQGQLEKACADSPRSFPRLIRIALQVVAGGALVEFSMVAPLLCLCVAGHRRTPVARAKPKRAARKKAVYARPPRAPVHPSLTPEQAEADAAHVYSAKEEPRPYRA
jgi:hypothetical protein